MLQGTSEVPPAVARQKRAQNCPAISYDLEPATCTQTWLRHGLWQHHMFIGDIFPIIALACCSEVHKPNVQSLAQDSKHPWAHNPNPGLPAMPIPHLMFACEKACAHP